MHDVGAPVVVGADVLGQGGHLAGGPPGAGVQSRRVVARHDRVVLQAPLPDATVGIVAGAHSVDGVDVPLPPSRHPEPGRGWGGKGGLG